MYFLFNLLCICNVLLVCIYIYIYMCAMHSRLWIQNVISRELSLPCAPCIWAHCDTNLRWYKYNIFKCHREVLPGLLKTRFTSLYDRLHVCTHLHHEYQVIYFAKSDLQDSERHSILLDKLCQTWCWAWRDNLPNSYLLYGSVYILSTGTSGVKYSHLTHKCKVPMPVPFLK